MATRRSISKKLDQQLKQGKISVTDYNRERKRAGLSAVEEPMLQQSSGSALMDSARYTVTDESGQTVSISKGLYDKINKDQELQVAKQQQREFMTVRQPDIKERSGRVVEQLQIRQTFPAETRGIPMNQQITVEPAPKQQTIETKRSFGRGIVDVADEFIASPARGAAKTLAYTATMRQRNTTTGALSDKFVHEAPDWVKKTANVTLDDPDVLAFGAGTALVGVGGAAPKIGKAIYYGAVGYEGYNFAKNPSMYSAGRLATVVAAPKVAEKVIQSVPKSKAEFVDTFDMMMESKRGTIGGRSARIRSGRMSKGELRKQSFNAQRNPNLFFDTQDKEIGVRVRSPELKSDLYTKQRTVRFGLGDEGQPRITQVSDKLLGTGGTLTTRFDNDISYMNKGSQPGFRKLFPKGFGSQSVKKGKQDLMGITLIERSGRTDMFNIRTEKGTVPEKATPRQLPVYSKSGSLTTSFADAPYPTRYKLGYDPMATETHGFRTGQREKIFSRLYEKKLGLERKGFIEDAFNFKEHLPKSVSKVRTRSVSMERMRLETFEMPESGLMFKNYSIAREEPRQNLRFRSDSMFGVMPKLATGLKSSSVTSFDIGTDDITDVSTPTIPKYKPRVFPTEVTPKPIQPKFDIFKTSTKPVKPKSIMEEPSDFAIWLPKGTKDRYGGFGIKKLSRKYARERSAWGVSFNQAPKYSKKYIFTGLEVR